MISFLRLCRGCSVKRRLDPVEQWKIVFGAMAHGESSDAAAFFNVFQVETHGRSDRMLSSPWAVPDHDVGAVGLVFEEGGAHGAGETRIIELNGEIWRIAILAFLTPGGAEFSAACIEPEVRCAVAGFVRVRNKLSFHIGGYGADGAGIGDVLRGEGFNLCQGLVSLIGVKSALRPFEPGI